MNKQKLFRYLSLLGVGFLVYLALTTTQLWSNRGGVINHKVDVPERFASEFSRVITKNRYEPMIETAFLNPQGQEISWSNYQGDYLLVNFWASWCSPCVVELPSLDKLQKAFEGRGLKVIAVSLDLGRTHDEIKEYLLNRNIGQFAAYFDHNQEVQKNIRMRGIPTTYLLDPEGNVLKIFEGDANWGGSAATAYFDALLAQTASAN